MGRYIRKEDSIQQAVEWLKTVFPLPWATDVNIVRKLSLGPDINGNIMEEGYGASLITAVETAEIQLLKSAPWGWMLDTLFHEWAHLRRQIGHVHASDCGKEGCIEQHDDEFYLEYGRIDRRYNSQGSKFIRRSRRNSNES